MFLKSKYIAGLLTTVTVASGFGYLPDSESGMDTWKQNLGYELNVFQPESIFDFDHKLESLKSDKEVATEAEKKENTKVSSSQTEQTSQTNQSNVTKENRQKLPDEEMRKLKSYFKTRAVVDEDKVEGYLNIRSEASSEDGVEILGKLYPGAVAEILDEKEEWSRIESGDVTGWVKNEFLILGDDAAEVVEEDVTYKAEVQAETLNIRKGAGTNYDVTAIAEQGDKLEVGDLVSDSDNTWDGGYIWVTCKGYEKLQEYKLTIKLGDANDTGIVAAYFNDNEATIDGNKITANLPMRDEQNKNTDLGDVDIDLFVAADATVTGFTEDPTNQDVPGAVRWYKNGANIRDGLQVVVTAEDGSTQTYNLTATIEQNTTSASLQNIYITDGSYQAKGSITGNTVTFEVPYMTLSVKGWKVYAYANSSANVIGAREGTAFVVRPGVTTMDELSTTFNGSVTAIRRGAAALSSSRTQYSSSRWSTRLLVLAMPARWTKLKMEAGL